MDKKETTNDVSTRRRPYRRAKICGLCKKSMTQNFLRHFRNVHPDAKPCELVAEVGKNPLIVPYPRRGPKSSCDKRDDSLGPVSEDIELGKKRKRPEEWIILDRDFMWLPSDKHPNTE
jgi:hypothetical protein